MCFGSGSVSMMMIHSVVCSSMSSFRNKLVGIFPKSLNRFPSFVCGTFLFQISISPTFNICCFEACSPQKYCFLLAFRMFFSRTYIFSKARFTSKIPWSEVCLISNKTCFFNHQISCFNGSSQSSHKLFQDSFVINQKSCFQECIYVLRFVFNQRYKGGRRG